MLNNHKTTPCTNAVKIKTGVDQRDKPGKAIKKPPGLCFPWISAVAGYQPAGKSAAGMLNPAL